MSTLQNRIALRLAAHDPVQIRMMGGICFMINGNMTLGTYKGGMMARVDASRDGELAGRKGAALMTMRDRIMKGFWLIEEDALGDAEFEFWVAQALAHNATLPAKSAKSKRK